MNPADLLIGGVLLLSVVVSLFRGFIKEVFSILVWAGAVFAAFQVSEPLAGALEPFIELPSARFILAFAAVFLLVLVIGGLISFLIGKMIEKTGLSSTDRLFGALFGLARGVVIVVIAVMLARLTPFTQDPWWDESRLLPPFERLAEEARGLLPESLQPMLDPDQPSRTVPELTCTSCESRAVALFESRSSRSTSLAAYPATPYGREMTRPSTTLRDHRANS